MDTQGVKDLMKEKHISVGKMSQELGMDPSTYYRKMQKNGEGFNAVDLLVFKRVLEMNGQTALDLLLS